jgi:hypothetical protein
MLAGIPIDVCLRWRYDTRVPRALGGWLSQTIFHRAGLKMIGADRQTANRLTASRQTVDSISEFNVDSHQVWISHSS